jgi:hypothetical protein
VKRRLAGGREGPGQPGLRNRYVGGDLQERFRVHSNPSTDRIRFEEPLCAVVRVDPDLRLREQAKAALDVDQTAARVEIECALRIWQEEDPAFTSSARGDVDDTGRIQEISGVTTSIAAAVEQQGAATQEIVRNVSQAAQGTSAATSNIADAAGTAEETGAAASQVLCATPELSRQSEHLSAEVARFLATVRAA